MAALRWRWCARALSALVFSLAAGCEPGEGLRRVDFRVVAAPGEDPFFGADEILVAVERAGEVVVERSSGANATGGAVGPLPFGEGFAFRVETLDETLLLARGRSFPFDVGPDLPTDRPDVLLGLVGQFAATAEAVSPPASPVAVGATSSGALVVASDGRVLRYVAHAPERDGGASLAMAGRVEGRGDAAWIALASGRLLAVGGAAGGAALVEDTGVVAAETSDPLLDGHRYGAALAALPGAEVVLVVGGSLSDGGEPGPALSRLEVVDGEAGPELAVTGLPDLAAPRRGATAVGLLVQDDGGRHWPRVVVVGGAAEPSAASLDPEDGALTAELPIRPSLHGAAVAAIAPGLVMVAGGAAADGAPVGTVDLVSVHAAEMALIEPPLDELFEPRSGAAAVPFGRGLALLVGGVGASLEPLGSAELLDVSFDPFPGEVRATGRLPAPSAEPMGARLRDGAVLVVDGEGAAVYVPPRERL